MISSQLLHRRRLASYVYRATASGRIGRRKFAGDFGRRQIRRDYLREGRLQYSGLRSLSSLSVSLSPVCSHSYHQLFGRNNWIQRPSDDDDQETTKTISLFLATSAAIHGDQEASILHRLLQWLRDLLSRCWDTVLVTVRGSEIILRLSPLIVLTPPSLISPTVSDWTWSYVTYTMQQLGPAFVKLCQWVATRRDIFPPNICDRFSLLHDRGIPHSWEHTHEKLVEAFGEDYQDKGLIIDENSKVVGIGSAAQVYKGKLVTTEGNGESRERCVAVKVLHPRFAELVERDLWFMNAIANLLHSIPLDHIRMLNLPRACENFGAVLHRQTDLRIEGENLKQFRSNFYRNEKEEDKSAVLFPRPMDDWMSTKVLVEELVDDAVPVADYLRDHSDEATQIRKELASPLLRAFLKMVFIDNFIHSDLHPGNVLIRTEPVKETSFWSFRGSSGNNTEESSTGEMKHTIVFLDAGIATTLTPNDRRNLQDLFRAVILNEGNKAGRLMVERAKYERCSQVEGGIDAFASGVEELVSEFHDRRREGLTLGSVRIGSLLSRVLDLCRIHGVEIDPDMASVVISTLVLEGLGRSLDSSLNLIDFAVPFVLGRGRV